MNNTEYVLIQLKDKFYYGDDFEFTPYVVKRNENFEDKYNEFVKVCENYKDYGEVDDFMNENFEKIYFETRYIEV